MSFKLMAQALSVKTGSCSTKMVLLKLCDNANDEGECWPSYQTIANHCELGKSTVMRHISKLIEMGIVSKETRVGKNGNGSNLYTITLVSKCDPLVSQRNPPGVMVTPPPSVTVTPEPISLLEPIIERELTFKALVKQTWADLGAEEFLPNIEAQKFFLHFSECSGTKMAFEKCKTFDIRKRMHKWKLNGYSKQSYSEGRSNA